MWFNSVLIIFKKVSKLLNRTKIINVIRYICQIDLLHYVYNDYKNDNNIR